jgi:hypothetical protein
MKAPIASPTSAMSKSAQVTFGLLLMAVLAIAFWEELTDSRLLRVVDTEGATPAQYASLHSYFDKYEGGDVETWDVDMEPDEVRCRHSRKLPPRKQTQGRSKIGS